jgi:ubiquinone/menaquinone biosynthesis C-methylase UbiE
MSSTWTSAAARERERMREEYDRRARELPPDRYAPWQAAELLGRIGRKRIAARLLRDAEVFPEADNEILEIGCGQLGWLSDMLEWGVRASNLSGIDLDARRIEEARLRIPSADLRVGDATTLPWDDGKFQLVVASTVFSSVLDAVVRERIAAEMWRVLKPGGAVLWYDVAVPNPANRQLRAFAPAAISRLFSAGTLRYRRVTLIPAIARIVAPRSWVLATLLEAVPWLRTHVLAIVRKP